VKVEAEEYSIRFDEAAAKVSFHGAMRLRGPSEYDDMKGLLRHALSFAFARLELDFSGLKFINSSGLGTIGQFIVDARRAGTTRLLLRGSHAHSWQARSLGTLHRIWADVELTIDDNKPRPEVPREPVNTTKQKVSDQGRTDSIFGRLAMRQTSFEDHPFFVHLREHPPADWVSGFLPFIGFWVKAFQDLLGIIVERVKDPTMLAIASHIRQGDAGHDNWFALDMALVGNPLPTYEEIFGPAHRTTRLASYALVAEALHLRDDRLLIVLLLALEAASYVFFTKMAEYLEHDGYPHELQYFGRRHLDAELEHGIVEAEMDNQVERSFETSPELRVEALALVDRIFHAFTGMFAGFVARPPAAS
jgi:hypothetical protein